MIGSVDYDRIPPDVVELCRSICAAGHEAHLVGGCVRDLILGRPVHDWDVATSALPQQIQSIFPKTLDIGIQHGTVVVLLKGRQVEVTTYRGEGAYTDGRRPDSVVFIKALHQDLQRRDFTINAIAIQPLSRKLVDPTGGIADLEQRLIRAVGEPAARFAEDGLRVLRAVRFSTVLEFEVEQDTRDAMPRSIETFRQISWERIRDELLKLLQAPRPSTGIELMQQVGLLELVIPELQLCRGVQQDRYHGEDVYTHALASCDEIIADPILRLAALLHDVGKPATARHGDEGTTFYGHEQEGARLCEAIARRLKLSADQRKRLCHLVAHHNFPLQGWTPAGLRRFLSRIGPEQVDDLLLLKQADLRGRGVTGCLESLDDLRGQLERELEAKRALSTSDLAIDGRRVMQHLDIEPGPRVGQILGALLERVLDDPSLNTESSLIELLDEMH